MARKTGDGSGVTIGGEASRRVGKPRETKVQRAEREARELAEREELALAELEELALAELGEAKLSEALSWGPDGEGAFLAGGTCRGCGVQLVGGWRRGPADGPSPDARHNPHRAAARWALLLALGRHECAKPGEVEAPRPEETSEEVRQRRLAAVEALIIGGATEGERSAALAARDRILVGLSES